MKFRCLISQHLSHAALPGRANLTSASPSLMLFSCRPGQSDDDTDAGFPVRTVTGAQATGMAVVIRLMQGLRFFGTAAAGSLILDVEAFQESRSCRASARHFAWSGSRKSLDLNFTASIY